MRSRAGMAGLIAIALLALPSVAASQPSPKDYSKNGATGDYADSVTRQGAAASRANARAEAESALRKRSEALEQALAQERYYSSYGTGLDPASQARQATRAGEGFAWGDAAIGAGVALAVSAALAGFVIVRRRTAPAGA
jgi:hypothetical protein